MGIFDSFRREKREERSMGMKPQTPPRRERASPGMWQVGDRIQDRYEIQDIKWGAMGIVYIALDHEWDRMFAIKTFQDKFLWDEDAIDRFMNEAETWVNLERHTNIVFANFVQKIEGKPYIVLEYIKGGDLSRYIGKLDIPHALDFAIQFCNGMDYAYKKLGVIHRDIKPQNVMITTEGVLEVTDFGLAKAVGQRVLGEKLEVGSLVVSRGMGTPVYMPSEQFPEEIQKRFHCPPREVTTRSDIYSFGVTFYQVLTGRLPFATIEQIFTQNPLNPQALNPHIPNQLNLLLLNCLKSDTRARCESFTELIGQLIEIYHALPREQKIFGKRYVIKGKKEPLTAIDWSNKGISLGELGRHQEAIDCLNKALELEINPRYASALVWINKGHVLTKLGRHQEAIACHDKALGINPRNALAWNNKGSALTALGRHQKAIAYFDKALGINPRNALAWNNKGSVLTKLGRHQEAIAYFDKALEINPRDAGAWNNKGYALTALGRHQKAIAYFDKALEIDSRYALAWNNKGYVLGKLARHQEAIAYFDKALEIDSRYALAWNNKGYDLRKLGRHREAIACYDKALEINPRHAGAWYNKGISLRDLGRHQEAIACFRKFIELAPPQDASYVRQVEKVIRKIEQKM